MKQQQFIFLIVAVICLTIMLALGVSQDAIGIWILGVIWPLYFSW